MNPNDEPDDALLDELTHLDPTMADTPPVPGSSRYHLILEHAMTTTETTANNDRGVTDPAPKRRRRRRIGVAATAAAAAIIAITAIAVFEPGRTPAPVSAREALATAAATTGEVSSLRSEATYDSGDEPPTRLTGEIDGLDYTSTFRRVEPDGTENTSTVTVIGTTRWEEADGKVTKTQSPPESNNAPFPQASEAVVKAALTGSNVTDLGTEPVRGQEAQHYRIKLTDESKAALGALDPSQLSRFELEYPEGVVGLEVWVADDLIRRISVRSDWETGEGSTIEFFDFGADITIRPPA
jgi:hypothetical protein